MSFALMYWILMLLWLVFGLWGSWPVTGGNYRPLGSTLMLFILLLILGWRVFGAPIQQ